MKKFFSTLLIALCAISFAKADSIWIEADGTGTVGKPQQLKVFFGSYQLARIEKVTDSNFQAVQDFTLWVVSPSGKSTFLKVSPADTYYKASFTPEENGVYVVMVENKQRKVEDWRNTSSKIGITKQNYYARTTIQVGNDSTMANILSDATIVATTLNEDVTFQVFYHGKPYSDAAMDIRHPEMKELNLKTDSEGKVKFHAPKGGRYFALVKLRFETPGTYKGVPFEVVREKSAVTVMVK